MKLLFVLFFSIILNFSMVAHAQTQKIWRIGVLYWSATIPGQVAMRKGLEQEVENINKAAKLKNEPLIELQIEVAGDGADGITRQIGQMQKMIASKPDAIIVQPTDNAALAEPLRAANQADIPVIAYDQYISGGKMAAYVTSNNRQAGYLGGEYIASIFLEGKKLQPLQLVLVEYPLVSSTVERLNGFLDALHDYGINYKILKTYRAVEPVEGKKVGESILRDFPTKNSIDVIFTVNDGGGLAVVDVLQHAGRNEIAIATVDGDPASVKNIREKKLTRIDAAQFCGPLGAAAAATTYAILKGEKVHSPVLVPTFPITQETLAIYPGWEGPIPIEFQKPWPAKQTLWKNSLPEGR